MTFDQWLKKRFRDYDETSEQLAEAAWDAATIAERERCAKIAVRKSCTWTKEEDEQPIDYRRGVEDGASKIAAAIRGTT